MRKVIFKAIAMLGLCLCLYGCVPAAIVTYAVTRNKTQSEYREYKTNIEKTNQERKDKGLEPMPIKTFDEWKNS